MRARWNIAPSLHHLTALSEGNRPCFLAEGSLLAALRRIVRRLGARVLWLGVSDTHLHVVVEATPEEIGRIRRDVDALLRALGPDTFERSRAKPIADQLHLESCWNYVVANREKHGLPGDPLLDAGSGLVDVIGARRIPGFSTGTWRRHLPRRDVRWLLDRVGVPHTASLPAGDAEVRERGAVALVRAAAAAVCWPSLATNDPEVVAARVAVMKIGSKAEISRAELVHALGVGRASSYRIDARDAGDLEEVVRRRIAYERVVGGQHVARRGAR